MKQFKDKIIDKPLNLSGEYHINDLIFNCDISSVKDAALINCDLNQSRFNIEKMTDMVNFTLTLNCPSFKNVEYSELMMYAMLYLLSITKGNCFLRDKILEIIPRHYVKYFDNYFKETEV